MRDLARLNIADDLHAQKLFHGRSGMTSLGFPAGLLDGMRKDGQLVKRELAKRFRTLGFAVRSHQATPSVAALARHADLADLYAFIYHATSATVHFRSGQLGRGAWGQS